MKDKAWQILEEWKLKAKEEEEWKKAEKAEKELAKASKASAKPKPSVKQVQEPVWVESRGGTPAAADQDDGEDFD